MSDGRVDESVSLDTEQGLGGLGPSIVSSLFLQTTASRARGVCSYPLLGNRRVNLRYFLHHPTYYLCLQVITSVSAWNWVRPRYEGPSGPAENRKSRLSPLFFLGEVTPILFVFHPWRRYQSQQSNKIAHSFPHLCLAMVDAFPLPRHRERSCCSRSQCPHENPKFTYHATRRYTVTKNCVEIIRAILVDIQRGAEQLQMSVMTNNYDGSRRFTFSHTRNVLT
jgi:hypothetical protein